MDRAEIIFLRNEKGWSQAELAKRSGLSVSAIQKIEQGIRKPQERTLRDIKLAFKEKGKKRVKSGGKSRA